MNCLDFAIAFGGAFRKATKLWPGGPYGSCGVFEDADANDGVEVTLCWGRNNTFASLAYFPAGTDIGYGTGFQGVEVAGPIAGPAEQIQKGLSYDYILPSGFTFEVPSGVTQIRASVWGAGGGATTWSGGSGGFSFNKVNVLPSEIYAVTVGAGGMANGGTGTASTFVSMTGGGATSAAGGVAVGGIINENGLVINNNNTYSSVGSPYGGGGMNYSIYYGGGWTYTQYGMLGLFPGAGGSSSSSYSSYLNHGAAGRVTIEPELSSLVSTQSVTIHNGVTPADYTVPGVFIYTVPTGVKSVRIQMWGAGGGGGGTSGTYNSGRGGGSGGYIDHVMQISEGQSFIVSVGAGGQGDQCNGAVGGPGVSLFANSSSGGESRFGFGTSVLVASGGIKGISNAQTSCTAGVNCGEGGTASGGVISTSGIQSSAINGYYGGGGANAPGNGGKGGSINVEFGQSGKNGQNPGGGGGGAAGWNNGWNYGFPGGRGGDGRILVTPFAN